MAVANALQPEQQASLGVIAENYGEADAINFG
jgi:hypothetical protein